MKNDQTFYAAEEDESGYWSELSEFEYFFR